MTFNKWSDEPFGTYAFKGYKKVLHNISIGLSNNRFWFKIALVLRKLSLQNRIQVVDAIPLDGFNVRLYPLDNLGDRLALFMPWYFEWKEFKLMREQLKPGSTFIDIGANTGYYSLMASSLVGSQGKVIAFEPNPSMYKRFLFNLNANEGTQNVTTFDIGLADKEGEFSLALNPTNLGGASLMVEYQGDHVMIKCRPLINVLQDSQISKVDFMKIDVEGAEPLILNPFFENAPKSAWPEWIIIETTEGIPFDEFGYQVNGKTKTNTILKLEA